MFIYINICSFQLSTILQNVDFRFSVYQTDDDRGVLRTCQADMSLLLMSIPWRPRKPSSCSSTDSVSSSNAAFCDSVSLLCVTAREYDRCRTVRPLIIRSSIRVYCSKSSTRFSNHLFSYLLDT